MKPLFLLALFAGLTMMAAAQKPSASAGVAGTGDQRTGALAADPLTLSILQSAGCPVGMKASFNSSTQMVKVRKPGAPDAEPETRPAPGPAQHVRLMLGKDNKAIVSARVTAYGLTARRRLDRSSNGTGDGMVKGPSNIRRTMNVPGFFTDNDGSLFADLVLPGFTAVNTVKLESIKYADGTIQQFSGQTACSVPVNPMMLITER